MRTRSQKRRNGEENEENEAADPIVIKSRETLVKCIHASKSCKQRGTKRKYCSPSVAEASHKAEKLCEESIIEKSDAADLSSVVQQDTRGNVSCNSSFEDHNTTELHWEDGTVFFSNANDDESCKHGWTVEFNDSPSTSLRKTVHRASSKEKELAELVHKVHLLCLLSRGRLVDSACSDSLIQASFLSLLPAEMLKISNVPKLTTDKLSSIVRWIHDNFQVRHLDSREGFSTEKLTLALGAREGTAEEVVALSVALFRALNIPARFVSILDVAPLKPEIVSESSSHSGSMLDTRVSSSTKLDPCQIRCKKLAGQKSKSIDSHIGEQLAAVTGDPSTSKMVGNKDYTCITDNSKETKRKGDLEFQMQLEMAITATAVAVPKNESGPSMNDFSGPLNHTPLKKLKKKDVDSPASRSENQGAVWSRKAGAAFFWSEVYCSGENLTGRWVHVDVVNAIIDGEEQVEATNATYRKMLRYVVAFAGNGAKDVTRRYCSQWYKIAPHRVCSEWWDAVLAPLKELESRSCRTATYSEVHLHSSTEMMNMQDQTNSTSASFTRSIGSLCQEYSNDSGFHEISKAQIREQHDNRMDGEAASLNYSFTTRASLEDMELETRALTEPLPTNQQAYRNHPLYAIERWLTKYQILHPKDPILGFCSGYPVYPRACVQTLQTKQKWLREALQLKANVVPAKVITRSAKFAEKQVCEPTEEDKHVNIELYGKWQTEPLCLPHAVNGVVPKNERGQVDVWSEKCLPPGTVHLRFPRLVPVANRLGINFAPAMIGFEFRNGRSVPIFEGIVVCTEFKEALLTAYHEEEERRESEERKRSEAQALSRWYQLIYSMVTRQRLSKSYEGVLSSGSQPATKSLSSIPNSSMDEGEDLHSRSLSEDDRTNVGSADYHEHIFPLEDQSYEKESSVRTKRCPCGFSIQVEEL